MSHRRDRRTGWRLALATLLWLPGCISFNVVRFRENAPVPAERLDTLRPGHSGLREALQTLGGPQIVWPSLNGDVVLAYAWQDRVDWGLSVSYSLEQFVNASASWDAEDSAIEGAVLIFSPDLELRSVEIGQLRSLLTFPPDQDPALEALSNTPR